MSIKNKQQLDSLINVDFGSQPYPQRILYSQNPNNLNGVRVVLDYRGLFPLNPFSLTYTFTESSLGLSSSLAVSYDVLSNPTSDSIPN